MLHLLCILYHENRFINILFFVSAYYAEDAGLYYGLSLSDNGFEVGFVKLSFSSFHVYLKCFSFTALSWWL